MAGDDVNAEVRKVQIKLGLKYAEWFKKDTFRLEEIAIRQATREVLKWVYGALVTEKLLTSLDSIPEKNRQEFYDEMMVYCSALDEKGKADSVKAIYALCFLIDMDGNY